MNSDVATAFTELLDLAPAETVDRLRTLAGDFTLAYAANTQRTWRADWRVWSAFCAAQRVRVLPASLDSLRAFLLDRIDAGRKRATLEHYLATLGLAHRLTKLPWPLETMEGRLMWRALRRDSRLSLRQRQAQGLTLEDVEKILSPLTETDPRDVRDRALLWLAYETMARRSELVRAEVHDLAAEPDGSGRLLIARAKADQEGHGELLYVSAETMAAVQRWLELAGHNEGALFRSIPHIAKAACDDGADGRYARPLTDGDIARIFKRRARAAGIDAALISGHSTRVGATQDLLAGNFSAAAVMKQGRWKSERMVMRYGESIEASRGAMAQLLQKRREKNSLKEKD